MSPNDTPDVDPESKLKPFMPKKVDGPPNAVTPPPPTGGRLTIIEQIVHYSDVTRQPGPEHVHTETRKLTSGESCYHRPAWKLKPGWNKLDTGWIEEPLLIIVQVKGGKVQVGVAYGTGVGERVFLFSLIEDNSELRLPVMPGCVYQLWPEPDTGDVLVSIKAYPR